MKKDWEIYRDTGMLGGYEPGRAIMREDEDGGVSTSFRDARLRETPEGLVSERRLLIQGKVFHVTSVFPGEATATPTDKMLSLIDAELEKEARSA